MTCTEISPVATFTDHPCSECGASTGPAQKYTCSARCKRARKNRLRYLADPEYPVTIPGDGSDPPSIRGDVRDDDSPKARRELAAAARKERTADRVSRPKRRTNPEDPPADALADVHLTELSTRDTEAGPDHPWWRTSAVPRDGLSVGRTAPAIRKVLGSELPVVDTYRKPSYSSRPARPLPAMSYEEPCKGAKATLAKPLGAWPLEDLIDFGMVV